MTLQTAFDEWTDLFQAWVRDLGLDLPFVQEFKLEEKFEELPYQTIPFGKYAGQPLWEHVADVPDDDVRELLTKLVVIQGDTELGSVEQARNLLKSAPNDYEAASLARIIVEEMRHGWQMCYLLIHYFGEEGRVEAARELQRRAYKQERLLGAVNLESETWLDFFAYTQFMDRDAKFQLNMLSSSGFAPLARSTAPIMREESFHLGTGNNGLIRILEKGRIPVPVVQRFMNKWMSAGQDLFGVERSATARKSYDWGLKGRMDELKRMEEEPDLEHLNEEARDYYRRECQLLVDRLNHHLAPDQPRLYVPDVKFNRKFGQFANQPYSVSGDVLRPDAYERHVHEALPTPRDTELLKSIEKDKDWILPRRGRHDLMAA